MPYASCPMQHAPFERMRKRERGAKCSRNVDNLPIEAKADAAAQDDNAQGIKPCWICIFDMRSDGSQSRRKKRERQREV